jgi:peptidoglycan LD-endopeptidase CwlK
VSLQTYTVKRGDSLSRIASRLYRDASRWRLLARANHIGKPWVVYVGQDLILPDVVSKGAVPPPQSAAVSPISLSDQRLATLAPALAERGKQLIRDCHAEDVVIRIGDGLRSWSRQNALYAKGRTAAGAVVTYARGGESFHNFGLAFDIELLDSDGRPTWDARDPGWSAAGRLGVARGLRWGGHWKRSKDLPHFELGTHLTLEDCRRLQPMGLEEIWKRLN